MRSLLFFATAVLVWTGGAWANTIDLRGSDVAVKAFSLQVNYVYTSPTLGHLSITGSGVLLSVTENGWATSTNSRGSFSLQADINPSLAQATSASVLVQRLGAAEPIWNSNILTAFGNPNSNQMDFVFRQVGPSELSGVGDGTPLGVIVLRFDGPLYSWNSNFAASNTSAKSDSGLLVPVPSAAYGGVVLMAVMGAGWWLRSRRRAIGVRE